MSMLSSIKNGKDEVYSRLGSLLGGITQQFEELLRLSFVDVSITFQLTSILVYWCKTKLTLNSIILSCLQVVTLWSH